MPSTNKTAKRLILPQAIIESVIAGKITGWPLVMEQSPFRLQDEQVPILLQDGRYIMQDGDLRSLCDAITPYQPGDPFWLAEDWLIGSGGPKSWVVKYRANWLERRTWKPVSANTDISEFVAKSGMNADTMPEWASRYRGVITECRPMQLGDLEYEYYKRCGCHGDRISHYPEVVAPAFRFKWLWQRIHGSYNPDQWIWWTTWEAAT